MLTQNQIAQFRKTLREEGKSPCDFPDCPCERVNSERFSEQYFCVWHFLEAQYGTDVVQINFEQQEVVFTGGGRSGKEGGETDDRKFAPAHILRFGNYPPDLIQEVTFSGCSFSTWDNSSVLLPMQVFFMDGCHFPYGGAFFAGHWVEDAEISEILMIIGRDEADLSRGQMNFIIRPEEAREQEQKFDISLHNLSTRDLRGFFCFEARNFGEGAAFYPRVDIQFVGCEYYDWHRFWVNIDKGDEKIAPKVASMSLRECTIKDISNLNISVSVFSKQKGREMKEEERVNMSSNIPITELQIADSEIFSSFRLLGAENITCRKIRFHQKVMIAPTKSASLSQVSFEECRFDRHFICDGVQVQYLFLTDCHFEQAALFKELSFAGRVSAPSASLKKRSFRETVFGFLSSLTGRFFTKKVKDANPDPAPPTPTLSYWQRNNFMGPVSLQGACVPRDFQLSGNFFAGAIDSAGIRAQAGKKPLPDFDQESCRLLKVGAERSGDMLGSHRYFAEEMSQYHQKSKMPLSEKFVMAWNYYTSNFGQSYVRPLGCLVALMLAPWLWGQRAPYRCPIQDYVPHYNGLVPMAETSALADLLSWLLPINQAHFLCTADQPVWVTPLWFLQVVFIWHLIVALKRKVKR